uniref:Uncharacterized protein n=1 Tax=Sphaerodactylus townsendi TaxID=933632 RepID=A0ACB8GE55_9SAUR
MKWKFVHAVVRYQQSPSLLAVLPFALKGVINGEGCQPCPEHPPKSTGNPEPVSRPAAQKIVLNHRFLERNRALERAPHRIKNGEERERPLLIVLTAVASLTRSDFSQRLLRGYTAVLRAFAAWRT